MKTIYTYPIPIEGEFSINLPDQARILDVTTKHGEPILVAMVDTEADSELVDFALRRTGTPMDDLDRDNYLGSFTISDGNVTFFLFRIKPFVPLSERFILIAGNYVMNWPCNHGLWPKNVHFKSGDAMPTCTTCGVLLGLQRVE